MYQGGRNINKVGKIFKFKNDKEKLFCKRPQQNKVNISFVKPLKTKEDHIAAKG